jgi:hypothetical protein
MCRLVCRLGLFGRGSGLHPGRTTLAAHRTSLGGRASWSGSSVVEEAELRWGLPRGCCSRVVLEQTGQGVQRRCVVESLFGRRLVQVFVS